MEKTLLFISISPWWATSCEYISLFLCHINHWCTVLWLIMLHRPGGVQNIPQWQLFIFYRFPHWFCFCVNIETCILYWKNVINILCSFQDWMVSVIHFLSYMQCLICTPVQFVEIRSIMLYITSAVFLFGGNRPPPMSQERKI